MNVSPSIAIGGLESFSSPFHDSIWAPGSISLALLSANYAYNGWYCKSYFNIIFEILIVINHNATRH